MKKKSIVSITGVILLTHCLISQASDLTSIEQNFDLEPCINGGVSAGGLYETQALEETSSRSSDSESIEIAALEDDC